MSVDEGAEGVPPLVIGRGDLGGDFKNARLNRELRERGRGEGGEGDVMGSPFGRGGMEGEPLDGGSDGEVAGVDESG